MDAGLVVPTTTDVVDNVLRSGVLDFEVDVLVAATLDDDGSGKDVGLLLADVDTEGELTVGEELAGLDEKDEGEKSLEVVFMPTCWPFEAAFLPDELAAAVLEEIWLLAGRLCCVVGEAGA